MYKNVLVVSDNPRIAARFRHLLAARKLEGAFTFVQTVLSKDPGEGWGSSGVFIDLRNDEEISRILQKFDLVMSLHCKQLFPIRLVQNVKCINVHPGYNPINRGWFPQVFSIVHHIDIGATIHEIDEQLDHGNIIAREKVKKDPWDTSSTLYNKIVDKEIELLERHIESILNNSYKAILPESEGNLFLKKDFNSLREIDLNKETTFAACIDHLRAMTFDGYDNCYFYTPEGVKVYVSIQLKPQITDPQHQ